jgi:hypothetical protein
VNKVLTRATHIVLGSVSEQTFDDRQCSNITLSFFPLLAAGDMCRTSR